MTSVSILPAFAGTWFSTSRFAYFGGDVLSWGSQQLDGLLVAGPKDAIIGEDPWIQMMVKDWNCYMTNFSTVQIDSNGKDYYAAGTWEIQKGTIVRTNNASDLLPYMTGMGIARVAILTWQENISDIEEVLTDQLKITDVTVIYFTDTNHTDWGFGKIADETGKFPPGYLLWVDGLTLGNYTGPLVNGHKPGEGYFDSLIFIEFGGVCWEGKYQGSQPGMFDTRIEANLPSVTSYVPGDVYVTGNWTNFAVDMEGLGTLLGKVSAGNVKYGSVEYSWSSSSPHNSTRRDPDPRADVNGDHNVNIIDLAQVARAFGATKDTERYDPRADINSDAVINILDIAVVAKNFGNTF